MFLTVPGTNTRTSPAGHGGREAEHRQAAHEPKSSQKYKIRIQNQKNHKLLEYFGTNEKIVVFFGSGDVGGDFFRAPRLRAVPALRSSLLLYSKGFALFAFKNGVEIAAVEGVAASIDRHAVPCCGPGTGGGVLEPARDATVARVYFDENHSVFE